MKKALIKTDSHTDIMATKTLRDLCIARRLIRCDECCFFEPNGGYGMPFCMLFTIIDRRCKNEVDAKVYELNDETVPKECKYWTSVKYTKERRESMEKIRYAQNAINKLKQKEKNQLRL